MRGQVAAGCYEVETAAAPRHSVAEMVALRNDYITKSTRPSRFSACNIEKTGKGLGTRLVKTIDYLDYVHGIGN